MKYPFFAIAYLLFSLICIAEVPMKEINRDQILSAGPEWQQIYDKFRPESDLIGALRAKLGNDLKVDVYLGLWCPDSRNNVPLFLKTIDQTGIVVPVRYLGVQRKASGNIRYYVDKVQVERVPTFIFYRGEKEIGRIVENPKIGMCEDMLEILSK